MTDTTITDAEAYPQDDGTGVSDGDENYNSAAWQAMMARYKGDGSYVGEDTTGSATLQFNDVDTTNEEVDVGQGYAYITESDHSVQSRPQTTYDTNVPIGVPYVALLPTEVTNLGLGTDTGNDLWLAIDPTAASDPVYIRHGSGLTAPSDPSVKLGTVNTSTGATTRANDLSSDTHKAVTTEQESIGTVSGQGDVFRLTDRRVFNNDTTQVQFSGLSDDVVYKIRYIFRMDVDTAPSSVSVRFNGDGASTGDYYYWDETGTEQQDQNEFLLVEFGGGGYVAGTLTVQRAAFQEGGRPSASNDLRPGSVQGRINTWGVSGAEDNNLSLSSIELIADDDFSANAQNNLFELWERDYS